MANQKKDTRGTSTVNHTASGSATREVIDLSQEGDEKLTSYDSMETLKGPESNWSRLEEEGPQGLLLALLGMNEHNLGVLASVLDAHPVEKAAVLKGSKGDNHDKTNFNEREDL